MTTRSSRPPPADITIECPPLPPLRWDSDEWQGLIALPRSWLGWRDRHCIYQRQRPDGTARLSVLAREADGQPGRPTAAQVAAYEYLVEHEHSIAAVVQPALLAYARQEIAGTCFGGPTPFPQVPSLEDLRAMAELSGVLVLEPARDAIAYVGLSFGAAWDEEHDAGVLLHAGRIVALGHADVSFDARLARADAGR
jgi:hypothetical protein